MEISKPPENEIALKIINKLYGLGVQGVSISKVHEGPILTTISLSINNKTPVAKIFSKQADIAIAVGVTSIDVRQIDSEIVIFVPNKERKVVNFLDALNWYLRDKSVDYMQIPILIGMDFNGDNFALDLADQPHILIAGSTGSGKSTLESSIIASLSMKKSPEELRLRLVDTKILDLTLFEKLPHIDTMVRTIEDWYSMANDLYSEVETRKAILAEKGARNIIEYNASLSKEDKMVHIVVIIDELADLIEKDKIFRADEKQTCKQNDEPITYANPTVPDSLKRIIQICRATGIHIIACTQRTTVDIVSGTIKANFPTRIALRLPQANDSRAIISTSGAENLLGKGDMLIQMAESDSVQRFHGSFVRLEDVEAIVTQRDRLLEIMK